MAEIVSCCNGFEHSLVVGITRSTIRAAQRGQAEELLNHLIDFAPPKVPPGIQNDRWAPGPLHLSVGLWMLSHAAAKYLPK